MLIDKIFKIPNITCGHCVANIKRELGSIEGVVSVAADAVDKTVKVSWNEPPATAEIILSALKVINYPPE